MPTSRFSFLFTYVVAVALLLGFHSSPFSALSVLPNNLLAQGFTPGGRPILEDPEPPIMVFPESNTPITDPTDASSLSNDPVNTSSDAETFFQNDGSPWTQQEGAQGTLDGNGNFINMAPGGGNPALGSDELFGGGSPGSGAGGGSGGGIGFENPLKYPDIESFLYALLDFVIKIGYVIAVFFIIFSGFKFVTAQGSPDKLDDAKSMLLWTIIGTAVLIGAQVLAEVIQNTINALSGPV